MRWQLHEEYDEEHMDSLASRTSVSVLVMDYRRVVKNKALGGVHFPSEQVSHILDVLVSRILLYSSLSVFLFLAQMCTHFACSTSTAFRQNVMLVFKYVYMPLFKYVYMLVFKYVYKHTTCLELVSRQHTVGAMLLCILLRIRTHVHTNMRVYRRASRAYLLYLP